LQELGYDDDEICLSRTLSIDGKSISRINGMSTTATILKMVGQCLVDSYSQHESVELLKTKNHLIMLDKFAGDRILAQKQRVKDLYGQYNDILTQISSLGGNEFERERMKSLLEYQIDEIESANLQAGESEEISERLKFLNSAEKIFQAVSDCEELLSEGAGSCIRTLVESTSALSVLSAFDEIESCRQRLDSVRYEVEDIADTLNDIKAKTDFDEKEFDRLDRRYDTIKSLMKKYGGSEEKALEFLCEAKRKLNDLSDSDFLLGKLEKDKENIYNHLLKECEVLTKLRQETAFDIENKIISELQQLGMKSSRFKVKFVETEPTSSGKDNVEFEFSANKGQEVKSLAKTASGGELSRFMLAVKNVFNEAGAVQTLVFDEIDSGISGETGNIVGEKIGNLAKSVQILCITHLPQVAVYADQIYVVYKTENDITTQTSIQQVSDDEIVNCLAQMMVGKSPTDTAKKQAIEMRIRAGK